MAWNLFVCVYMPIFAFQHLFYSYLIYFMSYIRFENVDRLSCGFIWIHAVE